MVGYIDTMRKQMKKKQRGQTLVEYALIVAFAALTVIVFLNFLGREITDFFGTVTSTLSTIGG